MTDQELQRMVQSELEWEPRVNAAHLGVMAKDGAVTLTGDVPSYSEKIAALDAAERVYGVRAVANEIEVKVPYDFTRDDSEIAEAASRMLEWNDLVPETVKAEVRDGFITLVGQVAWSYQSLEAEDTVRPLMGVKGVVNTISLKAHVRPTDVEKRITDAFNRRARLDARRVTVTATNGTAHLHGQVSSLAEKRLATEAASAAPGVVMVDNELYVVP